MLAKAHALGKGGLVLRDSEGPQLQKDAEGHGQLREQLRRGREVGTILGGVVECDRCRQ